LRLGWIPTKSHLLSTPTAPNHFSSTATQARTACLMDSMECFVEQISLKEGGQQPLVVMGSEMITATDMKKECVQMQQVWLDAANVAQVK